MQKSVFLLIIFILVGCSSTPNAKIKKAELSYSDQATVKGKKKTIIKRRNYNIQTNGKALV